MIIARSFYGAARSITDHSFTGTQRLQKRQVSKVLLDGLYDQGSPISKLFAVRTEVLTWDLNMHQEKKNYPW